MKKIFFLFLPIIFTLAILQIIVANETAEAGKLVKRLEEEASRLESENKILEKELALKGSFENLETKAVELGFSKNLQLIDLPNQKEVALKLQ